MGDRRLALVVAVDRYDDPALHALAAPAADAEALAEVLGDATLGDFEVEVLHNPTSSEATERVEDLLAARRPGDLVLLHFSCHGIKDDSGELYLAAANTRPDRLASTAIDAAWVNRLIQRSRAQRVVLLLDCCYGGAFERGLTARATGSVDVGDQFRQPAEGRGRVVITASTAMEYAFEGDRLTSGGTVPPSIFTGAVVEGIRTGDADRDRDGHVALSELYDYVYDRVREATPNQTPSKWEFGLRGELYVARNPRRPAQPIRPMPPAATPPSPRRRPALIAAIVAALVVAAGVVWWVTRPGDQRYRELLSLLPDSVAVGCNSAPPPAKGSTAQAYCSTGTYALWSSKFPMDDYVHPSATPVGDCVTAPAATRVYGPLPPQATHNGTISCEPEPAFYYIRWGAEDRLLTGLFQSAGKDDYAATYQRALDVLAQIR